MNVKWSQYLGPDSNEILQVGAVHVEKTMFMDPAESLVAGAHLGPRSRKLNLNSVVVTLPCMMCQKQ